MTRRTRTLTARALLSLFLSLILGACTSRAVRCDGALHPINASTPAEQPAPGASAEQDPGEP
jgi:hypothetical protein